MSLQRQLFQDRFLDALRRRRAAVVVFLGNGAKIRGQIEAADAYVVWLRNEVLAMVYKHAIVAVVPADRIDGAMDLERQDLGAKAPPPARRVRVLDVAAQHREQRGEAAISVDTPEPRRPKISYRHSRPRGHT